MLQIIGNTLQWRVNIFKMWTNCWWLWYHLNRWREAMDMRSRLYGCPMVGMIQHMPEVCQVDMENKKLNMFLEIHNWFPQKKISKLGTFSQLVNLFLCEYDSNTRLLLSYPVVKPRPIYFNRSTSNPNSKHPNVLFKHRHGWIKG